MTSMYVRERHCCNRHPAVFNVRRALRELRSWRIPAGSNTPARISAHLLHLFLHIRVVCSELNGETIISPKNKFNKSKSSSEHVTTPNYTRQTFKFSTRTEELTHLYEDLNHEVVII